MLLRGGHANPNSQSRHLRLGCWSVCQRQTRLFVGPSLPDQTAVWTISLIPVDMTYDL